MRPLLAAVLLVMVAGCSHPQRTVTGTTSPTIQDKGGPGWHTIQSPDHFFSVEMPGTVHVSDKVGPNGGEVIMCVGEACGVICIKPAPGQAAEAMMKRVYLAGPLTSIDKPGRFTEKDKQGNVTVSEAFVAGGRGFILSVPQVDHDRAPFKPLPVPDADRFLTSLHLASR